MRYYINSFYGGLQPGFINPNNKCFGIVVLQIIYRAKNIREHILNNNFNNSDINEIKTYMINMKKIDEETKENIPTILIKNESGTSIWNILNSTNPKIPFKYGDMGTSTSLLNIILKNIKYESYYIINLYNDYDFNLGIGSYNSKIINENPTMIINNDYDLNKKYIFFEPVHIIEKLVDKIYNNNYQLISFYITAGAHYFCYIKNQYNTLEWLKYNDNNITKYDDLDGVYNDCRHLLGNVDLVSSALLCYERIEKTKTVLDLICETILL
jgi:hypothetical protein